MQTSTKVRNNMSMAGVNLDEESWLLLNGYTAYIVETFMVTRSVSQAMRMILKDPRRYADWADEFKKAQEAQA